MAFLMDADRVHGFAVVNTHSLFHEEMRLSVRLVVSLDADPEIISFCAARKPGRRGAYGAVKTA